MDKIALVTGAGKGIGAVIASELARHGIAVAVAARTRSDIDALAGSIREHGGQAIAVQCDVTDKESIAAAVAQVQRELGSISILVNNAGMSAAHKFLGHPDELWHATIATNLDSIYYVTKAVAPMMVQAHWGRIINIASIASKIGARYLSAYTASKHGVLGLTRALAVELVGYDITVNAICPGYVDTPMTERSVENILNRTKLNAAQARAALEQTSPQNRLITPEEVAAVAVMLVGDEARGITGQAINVDGGAVMY